MLPFSHDLSDRELVLCNSLGSTKIQPAGEVTKESILDAVLDHEIIIADNGIV